MHGLSAKLQNVKLSCFIHVSIWSSKCTMLSEHDYNIGNSAVSPCPLSLSHLLAMWLQFFTTWWMQRGCGRVTEGWGSDTTKYTNRTNYGRISGLLRLISWCTYTQCTLAIWHVVAAVHRMRLESAQWFSSGSGELAGKVCRCPGKQDSLCCRGRQKAVSEIKVFLATAVAAG